MSGLCIWHSWLIGLLTVLILCHLVLLLLLWRLNFIEYLFQKGIIDVLFEIFRFSVPEWTDCFSDALLSIGKIVVLSIEELNCVP